MAISKRTKATKKAMKAGGTTKASLVTSRVKGIEKTIVVTQQNSDFNEVKAFGAEEFVEIDGESISLVYRDKETRTLWTVSNRKWECAVCSDALTLCRGCSGLSRMYPQLFGDCGEMSMCPNCVTLHGPVDSCRITSQKAVRTLCVEYWGRRYHEENEDRMFVSFEPCDYTLNPLKRDIASSTAAAAGIRPKRAKGSSTPAPIQTGRSTRSSAAVAPTPLRRSTRSSGATV